MLESECMTDWIGRKDLKHEQQRGSPLKLGGMAF